MQALSAAVPASPQLADRFCAHHAPPHKVAAAGCAQGDASRWQSMQCSLAEVPLLHLLLWHTLLIAATVVYMTAAGQSRSVKVCCSATNSPRAS